MEIKSQVIIVNEEHTQGYCIALVPSKEAGLRWLKSNKVYLNPLPIFTRSMSHWGWFYMHYFADCFECEICHEITPKYCEGAEPHTCAMCMPLPDGVCGGKFEQND